jgi:hypothetical protein
MAAWIVPLLWLINQFTSKRKVQLKSYFFKIEKTAVVGINKKFPQKNGIDSKKGYLKYRYQPFNQPA